MQESRNLDNHTAFFPISAGMQLARTKTGHSVKRNAARQKKELKRLLLPM